MEEYQQAKQKAVRYIHVADHMLTQTYPLVKDPKLLVAALENTFLSLVEAMSALLYFERLYKRIPPFHESFESKLNVFKMRVIDKYSINREFLLLIQDLREMIVHHKKSPVEFVRKNHFVICSENYHMRTLSLSQMRDYTQRAKGFVNQILGMVK